jgi:hypothetical protein
LTLIESRATITYEFVAIRHAAHPPLDAPPPENRAPYRLPCNLLGINTYASVDSTPLKLLQNQCLQKTGGWLPLLLTTNPLRASYPEQPMGPRAAHPILGRYIITALRHYISPSPTPKEAPQRSFPKNAKIDSYLGGDSVSTEAVAARRHAGTHLPVTWWKLEMPTTTWHLLLN